MAEDVIVTVDQEVTNIEVTVNFQEKGDKGEPGAVPVMTFNLTDGMILTLTTE